MIPAVIAFVVAAAVVAAAALLLLLLLLCVVGGQASEKVTKSNSGFAAYDEVAAVSAEASL